MRDYFLDPTTFARLVCTAAKAASICADIQVAVKKLQTAQVSAEALSEFKVKLQTLAFASSMCNRLCRLLGFIVLDGNLCLVMRLYQQFLQQLLGSSDGNWRLEHCCYCKFCTDVLRSIKYALSTLMPPMM